MLNQHSTDLSVGVGGSALPLCVFVPASSEIPYVVLYTITCYCLQLWFPRL